MVRLLKSDRPRARNYFSRREQWRLALMVAALGLVIVVMREVRRPANVAQVTQVFAQLAVAEAPAPAPIVSADKAPKPRSSEFSTEELATIRDSTYFRTAEKEAWFKLIGLLQQTPANELADKSVGVVGYVQLVQQPNVYRGKVVNVRGTVRQVTLEKPAANELGVDSYYRLVVQPSGGEIWPIFLYCLDLPADFPRGDGVAVDISATGFFFKNLSYEWQDGLGLAPVVLVNEVTRLDAAAASETAAPVHVPTAADAWKDTDAAEKVVDETATPNLAEVLSLAGWNAERFAQFVDGEPLTPQQLPELFALLWRVRSLDAADIADWTRKDVSAAELAANPGDYRGQFVRLSGQVARVEARPFSPADAERLEMPRYFECELALDGNAGNVTILTPRVPLEWLKQKTLDEPATVAGLFLQRLPDAGGSANLLLVAQQVAGNSFGRSVLATLGMEVGLLDGVRNHTTIRAAERGAFYEMLAAMKNVGAHQLIRFAQQNLAETAKAWEAELQSPDQPRRLLAAEVARLAEEGRYSVAPLFLDADRQIGQLVVVDGTARRIVRVDTSAAAGDGAANDVARRLGMDHYFEMEVFTEDSQNRPLVFCVRELPPGMPTGGDLHEPIRVAGFFFKSWRYRTRDAGQGGDDDGKVDALGKLSVAPLLIGRGPLRLEIESSGGQAAELVAGGLFVAALAGIWAVAWWFARGDRQFRQRTPAAAFSLPPGQSLDELQVPAVETPMNRTGPSASDTRKSP